MIVISLLSMYVRLTFRQRKKLLVPAITGHLGPFVSTYACLQLYIGTYVSPDQI